MELMSTCFETEEGVMVALEAQERAVDIHVTFKDENGMPEENLDFWLNAHEAKALGQALMAVAEGSLTLGKQYE